MWVNRMPQVADKSLEYARQIGFDKCPIFLELSILTSVVTKCGHKFCEYCLDTHIDGSDVYRCPTCKGECLEYTKLSDIHREEKIFTCPIPQCEHEAMNIFDVDEHITILCDYRIVECKCGDQVTAFELAEHEESHTTTCVHCNERISYDINHHECPYTMITCYRCKDEVMKVDLKFHNVECRRRIITCEVCGKQGLYDRITFHVNNCSLMECKYCDDIFTEENGKSHEFECVGQKVTCPARKCDHVCSLKRLGDHIQEMHIDMPNKRLLSIRDF